MIDFADHTRRLAEHVARTCLQAREQVAEQIYAECGGDLSGWAIYEMPDGKAEFRHEDGRVREAPGSDYWPEGLSKPCTP